MYIFDYIFQEPQNKDVGPDFIKLGLLIDTEDKASKIYQFPHKLFMEFVAGRVGYEPREGGTPLKKGRVCKAHAARP